MTDESNYDVFLSSDLEEYKGKWVAICEEDIVCSGENAKDTFEEAQKKCPKKKIMIARIPEEQTMIF